MPLLSCLGQSDDLYDLLSLHHLLAQNGITLTDAYLNDHAATTALLARSFRNAKQALRREPNRLKEYINAVDALERQADVDAPNRLLRFFGQMRYRLEVLRSKAIAA